MCPTWSTPMLRPSSPFSPLISFLFFLLLCLNQIHHPLSKFAISYTPLPLFFIPLNLPAVGVASGLVFCGDISSADASFMLWMVLEAGFTAPAVRPQRLSLSCLAVKWSAGPPGRGNSQDITVKGFAVTRRYWLNYISPLWLRSAAFNSRLYGAGFSLCLCIILGLPLFLGFSHLLTLCRISCIHTHILCSSASHT